MPRFDDAAQRITEFRARVNWQSAWPCPTGPQNFEDLTQGDRDFVQGRVRRGAEILVLDELEDGVNPTLYALQFRFRRYQIRLNTSGEVYVWRHPDWVKWDSYRHCNQIFEACAYGGTYRIHGMPTTAPDIALEESTPDSDWVFAGGWGLGKESGNEGGRMIILVSFYNSHALHYGNRLLQPLHDPYADKHGN